MFKKWEGTGEKTLEYWGWKIGDFIDVSINYK